VRKLPVCWVPPYDKIRGIIDLETHPNVHTLSSRRLRLIVGIAFCAAALAVITQASPKESVRAELIRLQNQSGLTLISFEGAGPDGPVYIVAFASRSLPERQLLKEKNGGVRGISSG
jgi:hypothetical protein